MTLRGPSGAVRTIGRSGWLDWCGRRARRVGFLLRRFRGRRARPALHTVNAHYDLQRSAELVAGGRHRNLVGGLWEAVGRLQYEYLLDRGLKPGMNLLDVGCGCLRGGVHFVGYLEPGRYYGLDISQDLLDAGWEVELGRLGLQERLPRGNLACNGGFDARSFGVVFDVAIAQSLFTHLPLNHIKLCLTRLADVVRPGGSFYATAFICPPAHDWTRPLPRKSGGTTHPAADPYHYRVEDLAHCAARLPWRFELLGDWGHPRGQLMLRFTRTLGADDP